MDSPLKLNRKDPNPSATMLPPDGNQYACHWLEDSLTIHSDGNVSCGCGDPHSLRSFGNINSQSVEEIFANPELDILRRKLHEGYRCRDCSLYEQKDGGQSTIAPRAALPNRLVVEPTVVCNLRCPNAACIPNNSRDVQTRDKDFLDATSFSKVIDELQNGLKTVYFVNYGDPFMHKGAEDMLLYMRQQCPTVEVFTSTNGIPLSQKRRADKIVASAIDHIVFTISGIDQESYSKYHVNGKIDAALKGLENVCRAKKANNAQKPRIVLRYLVFRWNDSDAELDRAIAKATELGVDQFSLYLTQVPEHSASFRLSPGTRGFMKYGKYIDGAEGYHCPWKPDESGMYPIENIANIGCVRWTSWRSKVELDAPGSFVNFSLNTIRPPTAEAEEQVVFVNTPWATYKYRLFSGHQQNVIIRVPKAFKTKTFAVELVTPNFWFPAEHGSEDFRCLGCLICTTAEGSLSKSSLGTIGLWFHSLRAERARVSEEDLGLSSLELPAAFRWWRAHSRYLKILRLRRRVEPRRVFDGTNRPPSVLNGCPKSLTKLI